MDTITKKEDKDDFLADLSKAREEHAQSVSQTYPNRSISNTDVFVNSRFMGDVESSFPDDIDSFSVGDYNLNNEVNTNGTNSEILGKGKLSAISRSGNDVRQQGSNTKKIREYLDLLSRGDKTSQEISAGEDGWLYRKIWEKLSVDNFYEFVTSIRGKIQRRQILAKDSIGRLLSEDVKQKFAKTIFADETGRI